MAGKSDKIKLVSTATKENGKKTGCYYTTKKNKSNTPEKMVKKMYDWVVRKHVEFKEEKIK